MYLTKAIINNSKNLQFKRFYTNKKIFINSFCVANIFAFFFFAKNNYLTKKKKRKEKVYI